MQTLIRDLLNYSRTNPANRSLEVTDLNQIMSELQLEFAETIQEMDAVLEVGTLCNVHVNAFQLRQVMNNLISNALKFAKPGTPSHISIQSAIEEGAYCQSLNSFIPKDKLSAFKTCCHITITDNGIGFDPKYKDKIFEVFQRLHGKDDYPGTGIGLAIVKKIIDSYQGVITASSEEGQGATFDIYLPSY